ncbi:hypothetical protein FNV43_RR08384 [Rhamnella rubrinervis]|uniref:WD repeat-containing protein 55 n=1 Tax=Rhamnella rubrinervis TaxID=2594499 RepID=A0A8K0MIW5_9ROSA|nr:hypothetical protein FNV43_RR08384 [Rhamnella rubrinervis]
MEVNLEKLAFDIDFHPSENLISAELINGDLFLVLEVHMHTESCRAVRFIHEGRAIVTGSPNRSILATDVETGSTIARLEDAHGDAVNRIINLTESTIASGDDEGCIKIAAFSLVWDTRQRSCTNSFDAHEDYVSDMTFASDSMRLLGTSGDGTFSVCNLRRNKIQTQSEFSEDELLNVVIMKKGCKVVCGSQSGTLVLYSCGYFKDCSDHFDLSPNSVDALLKLNEDRIITGSENGLISLVGILPYRIIQPIAEHSEYPIEHLGTGNSEVSLHIWDLDDILQNPGNALNNQAAVEQ